MPPAEPKRQCCSLEVNTVARKTSCKSTPRRRPRPAVARLHNLIDYIDRKFDPDIAEKIFDVMISAALIAISDLRRNQRSTNQPITTLASSEWDICCLCGGQVYNGDRHPFVCCANGHPAHTECVEISMICDEYLNIPYGDDFRPNFQLIRRLLASKSTAHGFLG
ncbi:unnamed protein product [Calicophoron daubneyi]|uniref:Uncharacterized protein n=1 Tax=Calicophoron daubneyi TaxID=300641 RepID=A0AAV2TPP2_CALDB